MSGVTNGFHVYFGDKWAGGVNHGAAAYFGALAYLRAYAVGAEDDGGIVWHFVDMVDKDDAFFDETFDHVAVVDDFVLDKDRRAKDLDRLFDALDRHINASAEASWIGHHDFHGRNTLNIGRGLWWLNLFKRQPTHTKTGIPAWLL